MKERRWFGSPGCGKTNRLSTVGIPAAVTKYGPDKVLVTSYTRAAAHEIASRGIPVAGNMVGTLHKIMYNALGNPELTEKHIKEWNNSVTQPYRLTGKSAGSLDEGASGDMPVKTAGMVSGDDLMDEINISRARMIPFEKWPGRHQMFFDEWTKFKQKNGYMDFADLIEKGHRDFPMAPGRPRVIFVDEAQDLTPIQLSLVRKWGQDCDYFILVGDDDQCQRAGQTVLTVNGYKNIENLDPITDKLLAYSRNDAVVFGKRNGGYSFLKAQRPYIGYFYNVKCNKKCVETTSNHLWYVKWNKTARQQHCVYLMQKNEKFRIGRCKLIRSDGCLHLGVRCRGERADAAWIICVTGSKKEASIYENYYSTVYGLPLVMFKAVNENELYTQKTLDEIFFLLSNNHSQRERAAQLLRSLVMDIQYPFWESDNISRSGNRILTVRSCNLKENIMDLPAHRGNQKVDWKPITSIETQYSANKETVYSLQVEKYKTYISNGIVTHNCVYGFTGASANAFLDPPISNKFKTVLGQSYRVPKAVFKIADRLIKSVEMREPKIYRPRDAEGEVTRHCGTWKKPKTFINAVTRDAEAGKTVMVLASCSYMLDPTKKLLTKYAIPFHNPYRKRRGDWNPLARGGHSRTTAIDILVAFLSYGKDENWWTVQQLLKWLPHIRTYDAGLIRKKAKAAFDVLKKLVDEKADGLETSRHIFSQIVNEYGIEPALDRDVSWLSSSLKVQKKRSVQFPIEIYRKNGRDGILKPPLITIGTIHCSPYDEQILTTDGYLSIGKLNSVKHRLVSYASKTNQLIWGGRNSKKGTPRKGMGYEFIVAKNFYNGRLITITTNQSKTRVTPAHKIQVKFSEDFFHKWVVYLMRRGDWWRVGSCTSGNRPYKSGGVTGRLATEQADSVWVLKVCKTKEEALFQKSIIQGKYGIPGLTFEAAKSRILNSKQLHVIHNITKEQINYRIDKLLKDFGLYRNIPLWRRQDGDIGKKNMRGMFLTVAANVLDGYMEIPVVNNSFLLKGWSFNHKPIWSKIKTSFCEFSGDVFSLEVLPYGHYISGGAVVHNSVKGGEADSVYLFPDISTAAAKDVGDSEVRDSLFRMFYVGMTRAFEKLTIMAPANVGGRRSYVRF